MKVELYSLEKLTCCNCNTNEFIELKEEHKHEVKREC